MNLVDRFVSYFFPVRGLKREFARQELLRLSGRLEGEGSGKRASGFTAADIDRQHGRVPSKKDANAELKPALATMRGRVHDMIRNNPYIAGATDTIVSNCVGTGIVPQAMIFDEKGQLVEKANSEYEEAFKAWADRADVSGKMHFFEAQELFLRHWVNDGEGILLLSQVTSDPRRALPFAIEVVDPARIADKNEDRRRDGGRIIQGVEYDAQGVVVAYWIYPNHPGSSGVTWEDPKRIPADRVIHRHRVLRAGQARGYPWYAPLVQFADALNQMLDWELTAARIQSCLAAMITTPGGPGIGGGMAGPATVSGGDPTKDKDGNDIFNLKPGLVWRGKPGEEVQTIQPNRPGSQFSPFVTLMLRSMGVGLNMSYEIFAKDFTKTNYSSARSTILEDRRSWRVVQGRLNHAPNRPVWREVILESALRGKLKLFPGRPQIGSVFYKPPGWEWVDPKNEVIADILAVAAGFKTRAEVCAGRGRDFFEVLRELALEVSRAGELGLELATSPAGVKDDEKEETSGGESGDAENSERLLRILKEVVGSEIGEAA